MKKLFTTLLSLMMLVTVGITNVSAGAEITVAKTIQANVWKSYGATVTYSGNKAKIGTEANGAVSWDADGEVITSDGVAVSVKANTSLEPGQLYILDVATWSNTSNSYSDEFWIQTQANSDGTASVTCGRYAEITGNSSPLTTITLNEDHTYTWKFAKSGGKTYAQICIDDYSTEMFEINASDTIGYIWAFGRQVGDDYKLDKPLEIVLDEDVCSDPVKVQTKEWTTFGASITKVNCDNRILIGTEAGGAVSWDARDEEINETGITVSTKVNVNLENDGELFVISTGIGSDVDTYSDELCVETDKTGGKYVATVFGKRFEIEEGINIYSWTFVKHGNLTLVSFGINDEYTDFNIMANGGNVVRYVWAFGREIDGAYHLDEPLEIYLRATPSYEDITFGGKTPDSSGNVEVTYTGDGITVGGFDEETLSVNSTYQYQIRKIDGTSQSGNWKIKTITGRNDKLDDVKEVGNYEIKFQVIGDMDEVGKGEQKTYFINVVAKKDSSSTRSYSSKDKNQDGVISCEEEMDSANWIWSTTKNACVYKVSNTSVR